jgi:hypothetical protein
MILFVENLVGEKRRERLHIGECRGTWNPVILWVGVGSALPDGGDAFQMQTGIS